MDARGPDTEWATGRRRACLKRGARPVGPGSEPGTHSREDTRAVKPFGPISQPDAVRGTIADGSGVTAPCQRCRAPRPWPPSSWSSPHAPARLPAARRPARRGVRRRHRTAPSDAPSSTPSTVGAIEHKTGATDVVLRFDEGGGFVHAGLHGGPGTGLHALRRRHADLPEPGQGRSAAGGRYRSARSSRSGPRSSTEDQIQTTARATRSSEGGLGAARAEYDEHDRSRTRRPRSSPSTPAASTRRSPSTRSAWIRPRSAGSRDPHGAGAFQKLADSLDDFDHGGTFASRRLRARPLPRRSCSRASPAPRTEGLAVAGDQAADFVSPADPNAMPLPGPRHDRRRDRGARDHAVRRRASSGRAAHRPRRRQVLLVLAAAAAPRRDEPRRPPRSRLSRPRRSGPRRS